MLYTIPLARGFVLAYYFGFASVATND